jgi:hypothetical protein
MRTKSKRKISAPISASGKSARLEQHAQEPALRHPIPEAVKKLQISRSHFYKRVAEGRIAITYDGARAFVTDEELQRYARTSLPATAAAATA